MDKSGVVGSASECGVLWFGMGLVPRVRKGGRGAVLEMSEGEEEENGRCDGRKSCLARKAFPDGGKCESGNFYIFRVGNREKYCSEN